MTTFVIGQVTVLDPLQWEIYCSAMADTLKEWGAELTFRGRQVDTLCGRSCGSHSLVLMFPDKLSARHWFQSIEYQGLLKMQRSAAEIDFNVFDAN